MDNRKNIIIEKQNELIAEVTEEVADKLKLVQKLFSLVNRQQNEIERLKREIEHLKHGQGDILHTYEVEKEGKEQGIQLTEINIGGEADTLQFTETGAYHLVRIDSAGNSEPKVNGEQ